MITVAGEALMDLLVDPSGSVTAVPGGAPFNVARTTARLGGNCRFLGRLSSDGFGQQLRRLLNQQHVQLAVPDATPAPTTLAVAQLDASGSADYRFYLDGTSAGQLEPGDIPGEVVESGGAFALGGLGILIEPIASSLRWLLRQMPARAMVLLDPNCRPRAVRSPASYRDTVTAFLARADVVKVSVDDLRFLCPRAGARPAARGLLEHGPAAVLVTDGPAPVIVHTACAERSVPVPEVTIADTVGAGDAFVAGFLTWWSGNGLGRQELGDAGRLAQATAAAVEVAAAACTAQGASLPAGFRWSAAPVRTKLGSRLWASFPGFFLAGNPRSRAGCAAGCCRAAGATTRSSTTSSDPRRRTSPNSKRKTTGTSARMGRDTWRMTFEPGLAGTEPGLAGTVRRPATRGRERDASCQPCSMLW
jgi:fructokinase